MAEDKRLTIEGGPRKPFKVYRLDIDDQPYELLGSYDTEAEARARPRWMGFKTAIFHHGVRLPRAKFHPNDEG